MVRATAPSLPTTPWFFLCFCLQCAVQWHAQCECGYFSVAHANNSMDASLSSGKMWDLAWCQNWCSEFTRANVLCHVFSFCITAQLWGQSVVASLNVTLCPMPSIGSHHLLNVQNITHTDTHRSCSSAELFGLQGRPCKPSSRDPNMHICSSCALLFFPNWFLPIIAISYNLNQFFIILRSSFDNAAWCKLTISLIFCQWEWQLPSSW